jgi:hypothetical protein
MARQTDLENAEKAKFVKQKCNCLVDRKLQSKENLVECLNNPTAITRENHQIKRFDCQCDFPRLFCRDNNVLESFSFLHWSGDRGNNVRNRNLNSFGAGSTQLMLISSFRENTFSFSDVSDS